MRAIFDEKLQQKPSENYEAFLVRFSGFCEEILKNPGLGPIVPYIKEKRGALGPYRRRIHDEYVVYYRTNAGDYNFSDVAISRVVSLERHKTLDTAGRIIRFFR